MIEFCAETYGWTPALVIEDMPWASIIDLLEARAERIQREQAQIHDEAAANILKPVGDNMWGIGVR